MKIYWIITITAAVMLLAVIAWLAEKWLFYRERLKETEEERLDAMKRADSLREACERLKKQLEEYHRTMLESIEQKDAMAGRIERIQRDEKTLAKEVAMRGETIRTALWWLNDFKGNARSVTAARKLLDEEVEREKNGED